MHLSGITNELDLATQICCSQPSLFRNPVAFTASAHCLGSNGGNDAHLFSRMLQIYNSIIPPNNQFELLLLET